MEQEVGVPAANRKTAKKTSKKAVVKTAMKSAVQHNRREIADACPACGPCEMRHSWYAQWAIAAG
jgi:hypothetical protein